MSNFTFVQRLFIQFPSLNYRFKLEFSKKKFVSFPVSCLASVPYTEEGMNLFFRAKRQVSAQDLSATTPDSGMRLANETDDWSGNDTEWRNTTVVGFLFV